MSLTNTIIKIMQKVVLWLLIISSPFFSCNSKRNHEKYKIFRYNETQGIGSLDPAFANTPPNMWAVNQIFNGLVEVDNQLTIKPSLAESWNISKDGLVYKFRLKKGVYFHDSEVFENGKGREVKASDFVYSFKRIVDPKTESRGSWIFNGKVKANPLGNVAEDAFKALDDYTLQITLQQPFAPFLKLLTMPYGFVVPQEAVQKYGKDFRTHPVGTGPFYFKIWNEGSSLVLLKNSNYWKIDNVGEKLPYLDGIKVSFISDENMAFINFNQKKFDFLSGINESSRDMIIDHDGIIKKEFADKFKVQKLLYMNTEYIGFQLDTSLYEDKNHPLLDKRIRQALNYAIDRDELITYLRNGLGIPGTAGIVPYPILFKHKIKGYYYNPQKSTELLKEAGYAKKKLHLTFYTTPPYRQIAEYLQKSWAKLGIEVKIEVNQAATHRSMADKGEIKFFRASWIGDYLDPENFLALFYGKNFAPKGPNKTHYKNSLYDNLYDEAQVQNDPDLRMENYAKMDQMMMEEAPVIILFYDELIRLAQNNVQGLEPNAMNMLFLESVKLN